jgi:hypothetical protein
MATAACSTAHRTRTRRLYRPAKLHENTRLSRVVFAARREFAAATV